MECQLFESATVAAYPSRAHWDAVALDLLGTVLARWKLTPGPLFSGGFSGTVMAVEQSDGSPAVLKLGYPHEEAIAEAVALCAYPEGTAPRVLKQDAWLWALLLERIAPGAPLSESSLETDDALRCGAKLLTRISATGPRPGIPTLENVVRGYAAIARERWDEQRPALDAMGATDLVASAIAELDDLADGGSTTAMVHGDYNPGNILRSHAGWIAIDPKPMIGDPCYDLWPLVSQLGSPFDQPDPRGRIAHQLTLAADVSGCDPVRAIRWAFARTGLNVSWYLHERNPRLAAADVAALRVWSELRDQVL